MITNQSFVKHAWRLPLQSENIKSQYGITSNDTYCKLRYWKQQKLECSRESGFVQGTLGHASTTTILDSCKVHLESAFMRVNRPSKVWKPIEVCRSTHKYLHPEM